MTDETRPASPVEFRSVTEFAVRFADRIIELVAMPYDADAAVLVHGRPCVESIAPGSFDGVERRANRVKVNRDHDLERTVGRAVALHPSRTEGLVAELRIARTPLGDETLALAEDLALEPSVGFAIMPGGERWLDQRARRRVTRAFLDHIAMVPEGAYEGRILAVRATQKHALSRDDVLGKKELAGTNGRTPTPNLDQVRAWLYVDNYGA